MSDFSQTLKSSLSKIIGTDNANKLDEFNILSDYLTDDKLSSFTGTGDAQSLDTKEILEIIYQLTKASETATGEQKTFLENIIQDIQGNIKDLISDGAVEQSISPSVQTGSDITDLLNDSDIESGLESDFSTFDTHVQRDILEHYFQNNDFDKMQKLLKQLDSVQAHDLIIMVAGDGEN